MTGIDYSKWDHIEASSSSFGSDDGFEEARASDGKMDEGMEGDSGNTYSEGERNRRPRVVRLSQPSRVMIGPGGVQLSTEASGYPQAVASPFRSGLSKGTERKEEKKGSDENEPLSSCNPNEEPFSHPARIPTSCKIEHEEKREGCSDENREDDENDEEILYRNLTLNGGREGDSHLWAQTDDTLTVSFIVPMDTRGKGVKSVRIFNEEEKEGNPHESEVVINEEDEVGNTSNKNELARASMTTRSRISISFASPEPLGEICRTFRYRVKTDEDLLEGCWELLTLPKRALRLLVVHLFKEPIGVGVIFWWDRCFVSDITSVVDPRVLASRRDTSSTAACKSKKAEAFQKVWKEAHEMFQQKIKQRCKRETE